MNNWHLLLLAFVAVFQPIASFTERNLVDGREQCSDRRTDPLPDSRIYGTRKLSPNRLNYYSEKRDGIRFVKESVVTRPLSSRLVDHQERDVTRRFYDRISSVNRRSEIRDSEQEKHFINRNSDIRRAFSRRDSDEHKTQHVLRHTSLREARYGIRFSKGASIDQQVVRGDTQRAPRIPFSAQHEVEIRDKSEERRVTRESDIRNMLLRERDDVKSNFDEKRHIVRDNREERVRENYRVSSLERISERVLTRFNSREAREERQRLNIRGVHAVNRVERYGLDDKTSVGTRRHFQERFSQVRDESQESDREARSDFRINNSRERLAQERRVHIVRSENRLMSREGQAEDRNERNRNMRSVSRFNSWDRRALDSISERQGNIREMRSESRRNYRESSALDRSQTLEQRDERSLERLINQRQDKVRGIRSESRLDQYRDAEDIRHIRHSKTLHNSRKTQDSRERLDAREEFEQRERSTQSHDRLAGRRTNERQFERKIQENDSLNLNVRLVRNIERDFRAARDVRSVRQTDTRNPKLRDIRTVLSETRREESREREVRNRDNLASARREHKTADQQREIRFLVRSRSADPVQAKDIIFVSDSRNMDRESKASRFLTLSSRFSPLQDKIGLSQQIASLYWHYLIYVLQGLYICGVLMQLRKSDDKNKARYFNMWPAGISFKTIKVD